MTAWNSYEPYDPGVDRPLHELSQEEARAAFERLMAAKDERVEMLRRLAEANGIDLDAPDGIQRLNDWFVASVEADEGRPDRMENIWYSVVNDLALFLGEHLIDKTNGSLEWVFWTNGKSDFSYQRHVIAGFTNVANPHYYIDLDWALGVYGHRIVAGHDIDRDYFVSILEKALSRA
jgi:hypothetical protein